MKKTHETYLEELNESFIQNLFYLREQNRFKVVVPNANLDGWSECDLACITKANYFYEYEIKVSRADFKADAKKTVIKKLDQPEKIDGWNRYYVDQPKYEALACGHPRCPKHFYYIVPDGLIVEHEVPAFAGLIYICNWGHGWFFREVKSPMKLNSQKVDDRFLVKLYSKFYFRYWQLRREG